MVGRKRKPGKRKPSGDLIQEKTNPQAIAASMPHRRHLPVNKQLSQKAESPFGALNLIGAISDMQFDAGEKFQRVVARYRAVIESPRPSPGVLASQYVAPPNEDNPPIPFRFRKPLDDTEALNRKLEYDQSFEAIKGYRQRVVIKSVVVQEEQLSSGDLAYLRAGLDNLVDHYGLTSRPEFAKGGK